jgi:drug/metabolite transporter (DMT)-like permease
LIWGIIYALLAALMTTAAAIVAQILLTQTNLFMIGFFRQCVAFVLFLPLFAHQYRIIRAEAKLLSGRQGVMLFIRSLFSALSTAAIFWGLLHVSLTDTVLLSKTSPLFAGLIAWLLLRKKLEWQTWVGIGLSFAGIALIIRPGREVFVWGSFIPLASGFLAACSYIMVRRLSRTVSAPLLLASYTLFTTILWALPLPWTWQTPATGMQWLLLIAVGLFGSGFQGFLTVAYARARVTLVSTLLYTSVVYAALWDALVRKQIPALLEVVGILLVLAGGVVIAAAQRETIRSSNAS